jgi:hypothetical protein
MKIVFRPGATKLETAFAFFRSTTANRFPWSRVRLARQIGGLKPSLSWGDPRNAYEASSRQRAVGLVPTDGRSRDSGMRGQARAARMNKE